jgi:hypothetical protein
VAISVAGGVFVYIYIPSIENNLLHLEGPIPKKVNKGIYVLILLDEKTIDYTMLERHQQFCIGK